MVPGIGGLQIRDVKLYLYKIILLYLTFSYANKYKIVMCAKLHILDTPLLSCKISSILYFRYLNIFVVCKSVEKALSSKITL